MIDLNNMPLTLIEQAKRHLRITWSDEDTDDRLVSRMADAETTLDHKLGAECDFFAPGPIRRLYLDYLLYSWHDALNEFDKAYLSEILQIRHIHEVRGETFDPMNFKSRFYTYNDGVLYICESATQDTDFNAVTNVLTVNDLDKIQKLDYAELSKRERDMEFAESVSRSLDMKVRTLYHSSATTNRQVLIGRTLYDIFEVDPSSDKNEMYLYLEKVRDLS